MPLLVDCLAPSIVEEAAAFDRIPVTDLARCRIEDVEDEDSHAADAARGG